MYSHPPNGYIIACADLNSVVYIYNTSGMLSYRAFVAQVSDNTLPRGIYWVQVEETMHKVTICYTPHDIGGAYDMQHDILWRFPLKRELCRF